MKLHPGGICIRPLKADDFQAILGLIRQLPGYIYRWASGPGLLQAFEGLLEGKSQEAYVATLHQRVIGFISLYYMRVLHRGGLVASIQELVVTEELQDRGVGQALVEVARARANELRCVGIEIACGLSGVENRLPARKAKRSLEAPILSS